MRECSSLSIKMSPSSIGLLGQPNLIISPSAETPQGTMQRTPLWPPPAVHLQHSQLLAEGHKQNIPLLPSNCP